MSQIFRQGNRLNIASSLFASEAPAADLHAVAPWHGSWALGEFAANLSAVDFQSTDTPIWAFAPISVNLRYRQPRSNLGCQGILKSVRAAFPSSLVG